MIRSNPARSRGAALIIALMVVALVAVIGASMGIDYLITVKRASNQLIGEQAYSYGIAAEKFAVKALQMDVLQDVQEDGERRDSLDEFWAKDAPPFQTDEGAYGGKLYDLSGRFNINVLMNQIERSAQDKKNAEQIMTVNEARFVRLLMSLSDEEGEFVVSEPQATAIMVAVIDWLDADGEPTGFNGAEDDYYAGIKERPPYRAANRAMVSPSELLLVAHMTPEIYKRLLPHITVWPMLPDQVPAGTPGGTAGASGTEQPVSININTATENVLRSLNVPQGESLSGDPATRQQVAPLLERQLVEGGFPETFATELQTAFGGTAIDASGLGIKSDFFLLDGHVTIGGVATHMQSVISRKDDNFQVLVRSSGGL